MDKIGAQQSAAADASLRRSRGFTLIEVTVVVLIIGLLISVAIPSFLGTKGHAQNRAAEANLRNAFGNAKALFTEHDSYSNVTAVSLHLAEPTLVFTAGPSTSPQMISVASTDDVVVLAARSASGECLLLGDDAKIEGTVYASLGTLSCDAAAAPSLPPVAPKPAHATPGGGWAVDW